MRDLLALVTTTLAAFTALAADVQINGHPLTEPQQRTLATLEQRIGPVPPGAYWYDAMTGAAGHWGGPAAVFLPAGLALAAPLPPQASGGGDGRLTGVFINGRELHPADVTALRRYGPVIPGRYGWDSRGNVTFEQGGRWLFNFYAVLAAQRNAAGGGSPYYRSDVARGESTFVGRGCAAVSGRLRSGDSSSGYSYYVGCD